MSFSTYFLSQFSPDERQSELIQLLSLCGENVDRDALETLNAYINSSTEILAFPEYRLRSWLSALLVPVSSYQAASGTAYVSIPHNTDPDQGDIINADVQLPVVIDSGAELKTMSGKIYSTSGAYINSFNVSYPLAVIQGSISSTSGTYHSIITIDASNVVLDSVSVTLDGTLLSAASSINTRVTPYNGYYVFIHGTNLHIIIFRGPSTPDPEGKSYTVTYRVCDGADGNITSIVGLKEFSSPLKDSSNPAKIVDYTLSNDDILNGRNTPSRTALINKFRSIFWTSPNVSSVAEYTAWFRNQPEVGDCLVLSDYEKWRRNNYSGTPSVTGIVSVYLMDSNGQPLSTSTKTDLDSRLSYVRDIAIMEYLDFSYVYHTIEVIYTSGASRDTLLDTVTTTVNNYYTLSWLLMYGGGATLFNDLLVTDLYNSLQSIATGVTVIPYHSRQFTFVNNQDDMPPDSWATATEFTLSSYPGESIEGSYYEWTTTRGDDPDTVTYTTLLKEFPDAPGSANATIYQATNDLIPQYTLVAGHRTGLSVTINSLHDPVDNTQTTNFEAGDTIKCYWKLKNTAIASINVPDAARALMEVKVTQYVDN